MAKSWLDIFDGTVAIKKEMEEKIKPIEKIYKAKTDVYIFEQLPFNIGDMLHYKCGGSGYVGIYKGIKNGWIYMDICNKSGELKGKEFSTPWLDFDRFTILKTYYTE